MPDDTPHGPMHSEVRHERRDARLSLVVWFSVIMVVAAILVHVVLYFLLGGLERAQQAQEKRGPGVPSIARENRPHFPEQLDVLEKKYRAPPLQVADIRDMDAQRGEEEARLGSYGWSDVKQGAVRIPIDEALRRLEQPGVAKAQGIIARDMKEAK